MNKILSYAFFVTLLAAALVGCGGGEADEADAAGCAGFVGPVPPTAQVPQDCPRK